MGYVACMGANRNAYRALMCKTEGEKPLGIPCHRWEHNINMSLNRNVVGRHGLDSSGLGQEQMAGSCEHVNETKGFIKCGQ